VGDKVLLCNSVHALHRRQHCYCDHKHAIGTLYRSSVASASGIGSGIQWKSPVCVLSRKASGIPDIVASTVRPFQHRYAVSLGCVEHGRVCRVMPVVAMQKDHVAIHKQSFKP